MHFREQIEPTMFVQEVCRKYSRDANRELAYRENVETLIFEYKKS